MFALFRVPRDNIRRRVEQQDYMLLSAVTSYSDLQLNHLPKRQREYAVGFILSVWACKSASSGNICLSPINYRYIENLGMNCASFLSSDIHSQVEHVMDELVESGLIPHPTRSKDKRSFLKRNPRSSNRRSGKRNER